MSDMAITFVILGVTMVLFLWSRFSPDIVAMASLLALFLTGIIDLGQTLSGFANSTVILIAALFVVGEGLTRTSRSLGSPPANTAAKRLCSPP